MVPVTLYKQTDQILQDSYKHHAPFSHDLAHIQHNNTATCFGDIFQFFHIFILSKGKKVQMFSFKGAYLLDTLIFF